MGLADRNISQDNWQQRQEQRENQPLLNCKEIIVKREKETRNVFVVSELYNQVIKLSHPWLNYKKTPRTEPMLVLYRFQQLLPNLSVPE